MFTLCMIGGEKFRTAWLNVPIGHCGTDILRQWISEADMIGEGKG